ncbi:hypothetical protein UFOVP629_52 [uncultured Caudovirales phage]|uniref:Uncharacterized protein n=1 Tax=uncultured Caudovirales phage TaxID=2100421 RepID=A0A6J5NA50_9CAUD|nr:hypothetical protein UFOVP629_52 [uncultured Caudovirales phage]
MAFNIRSIAGRNTRPQPNASDMEHAKAYGITSRRVARKNIDDLRSSQKSAIFSAGGPDDSIRNNPFDPMTPAYDPAPGQRLMAAGSKDQKSIKNKIKGAVDGNMDKYVDSNKDMQMNPFDDMSHQGKMSEKRGFVPSTRRMPGVFGDYKN